MSRGYRIREKTMGGPVVFGSSSGGSCRIRHTEYLTDVTTVAYTQSLTQPASPFGLVDGGAWILNPGNADTFPWLSAIANQFEEYEFNGLLFHFRSTSTDAIASNTLNLQLGVVIGATDYNALHPVFSSKQQMDNYEWTISGKPSLSWDYPVECKRSKNVLGKLYVTNNLASPPPQTPDPRLYHLGLFQLATQGFQSQSAVTIGELWVTYDVTLSKPCLTAGISPTPGFSPAVTHLWNTSSTSTNPLTGVTASTMFGTQTAQSLALPDGTTLLGAMNTTAGSSFPTCNFYSGTNYFYIWNASPGTRFLLLSYWLPQGGYVTQETVGPSWSATINSSLEFITATGLGSAGGGSGDGKNLYSPGTSALTGNIPVLCTCARFFVTSGIPGSYARLTLTTPTTLAFGGSSLGHDTYLIMLPSSLTAEQELDTIHAGARYAELQRKLRAEEAELLQGAQFVKMVPKDGKVDITSEVKVPPAGSRVADTPVVKTLEQKKEAFLKQIAADARQDGADEREIAEELLEAEEAWDAGDVDPDNPFDEAEEADEDGDYQMVPEDGKRVAWRDLSGPALAASMPVPPRVVEEVKEPPAKKVVTQDDILEARLLVQQLEERKLAQEKDIKKAADAQHQFMDFQRAQAELLKEKAATAKMMEELLKENERLAQLVDKVGQPT